MEHEGHRARLKARFCNTGLDGLLDHEALELLLCYAIPRRDVKPMAHALLQRFGSLEAVLNARREELMQAAGVGENAALLLRLTGELERRCRMQAQHKKEKPALKTALDAARYAAALCAGNRYECVYVASLDKNKRVLHSSCIHTGSLTETPLYPRNVVEEALLQRAHGVLLIHNHPSGDPTPSKNDATVTENVMRALDGVDITLFDHIIAGDGCCYSMSRGIRIELSAYAETEPQTAGTAQMTAPPEYHNTLPQAAETIREGDC